MIVQSVSTVFEQNIIDGRFTSPISKLLRRFNTFILTYLDHKLKILSLGKMRWFITFMCDLTRYKWVHMLPSKESKYVFQKIEEWVKIVELETGCKVQHFRTDGGREYWGDLMPFLKRLGIQHKETPPYTPQSNG